METVEVAVVGAGVMGSATAWRLAQRGREVVLLEQFSLGHSNGSSHGPTRIFRFVYPDSFYVAMAKQALRLWRELEEESEESLLEVTGGIDIGPEESLDPIARALQENGAAAERIDKVSSRFPGISSDYPALFSQDTGIIAASQAVASMARSAQSGGVVLQDKNPVRIDRIDEDRVVLDLNGEFLSARSCIASAGAWIHSLLAPHDLRLPLTVTREQIVYFPQLEDFPVLIDRSTQPTAGFGLPARFDSPGARFGNHKSGRVTSVEAQAEDDPRVIESIVQFAAAKVPAVKPEPVATETCLYTNTPDEDFVIDSIGALVVASPCSGHGFKFAPLIGEMLARLALGEEPIVDLRRFSLSRF